MIDLSKDELLTLLFDALLDIENIKEHCEGSDSLPHLRKQIAAVSTRARRACELIDAYTVAKGVELPWKPPSEKPRTIPEGTWTAAVIDPLYWRIVSETVPVTNAPRSIALNMDINTSQVFVVLLCGGQAWSLEPFEVEPIASPRGKVLTHSNGQVRGVRIPQRSEYIA